MGKRHNRKRTRSRPRHGPDTGSTHMKIQHTRSDSTSSNSTNTSSSSSQHPHPYPHLHAITPPLPSYLQHHYQPPPLTQHHWQHAQLLTQHAQQREVESQRLLIFGGLPGEEMSSLLEPMLKVVTDLFDGFTDYQDP